MSTRRYISKIFNPITNSWEEAGSQEFYDPATGERITKSYVERKNLEKAGDAVTAGTDRYQRMMRNAMAERRRKAATSLTSPETLNGFRNHYWLNQARQYGFNTAEEVMDFQRQNGLTADGMMGANTIRAFRERNNRQRPPVERQAQKTRTPREAQRTKNSREVQKTRNSREVQRATNPREYEYSTPNGTTRSSSATGYRGLDLSNEFFNNTGIIIPNTEDIVVSAPDVRNRTTPYIPTSDLRNRTTPYIPTNAQPNKDGYYETKDRFGMTVFVPENEANRYR